ncbi:MAG TPA: transposase [Armatimonadota bacterium]|nr:transposase [Armatimonadota bacterium]
MPGVPHHVTQRGNRGMDVFFSDADRAAYLRLLGECSAEHGADLFAYCLMSNHVHLVLSPQREDSLALAVGWTHFHYTRRVNFRKDWRGHLWQGRFHSCALDDAHCLRAIRYVELNPVRAGLVEQPEQWPWSSAPAHLNHAPDPVLAPRPWRTEELDWAEFLSQGTSEADLTQVRRKTRTGRPLGESGFIEQLESQLGRQLRCRKPGPKGPRKP